MLLSLITVMQTFLSSTTKDIGVGAWTDEQLHYVN